MRERKPSSVISSYHVGQFGHCVNPVCRISYQLVFTTGDVGNFHVVGGGGQIFELLVGEDVESRKMDLCVTMLASLGGGHLDDLAGTTFDDDETVLSQGGTLHGIGGRSTGVGAIESVLMLWPKISKACSETPLRSPQEGGEPSKRDV